MGRPRLWQRLVDDCNLKPPAIAVSVNESASMPPTIRMIHPASQVPFAPLAARVAELSGRGFAVLVDKLDPPAGEAGDWPYSGASIARRAEILSRALLEEDSQIILCARGGYGCSDLLPLLPWQELKARRPAKWVVGFSDVSALHCALWAQLGWPCIHGPMPASELWGRHSQDDIRQLLALLQTPLKQGRLALEAVSGQSALAGQDLRGWLFGGCFSVLTNLIGTPYFPHTLAGAILFVEDTGENPGRLMRYWNQWLQSGVLQGVRGLIIGNLREHGDLVSAMRVKKEFGKRWPLPVWSSDDIGHTSPNFPLVLGAEAVISAGDDCLSWQLGAS